ncbi:MAG: DinB family protein [Anaerolineales bacterium]
MQDPKVLAGVYQRNQWMIGEQTRGLTHADSLLQPTMRGNCLNFVLGHLLASRELVMDLLSMERLTTEEQFKRYAFGADPLLEDGPGVIPLDDLLAMLQKSADLLSEKISALTPEELAKEVMLGSSSGPLGERVEFFSWHDTYHVGQTEYLRQLSGVDDKVI